MKFQEVKILSKFIFPVSHKSIFRNIVRKINAYANFIGLADMLKTEKPVTKSEVAPIETSALTGKINLLAENVQSLLDRNQTIDEEIKSVKSNVQSMTNQIHQINVSSSRPQPLLIHLYQGESKWHLYLCKFL